MFTSLRIIPAYAGSTKTRSPGFMSARDHPRIRGEHVDPITIGIGQWGSSPHTRGAPDRGEARQPRDGIIPAYAGSTACTATSAPPHGDHPRIRGEHRLRGRGRDPRQGIIPAYAGSTGPESSTSTPATDHPRIRGEHPLPLRALQRHLGSSPHTRGARDLGVDDDQVDGIIPAYAGSTTRTC